MSELLKSIILLQKENIEILQKELYYINEIVSYFNFIPSKYEMFSNKNTKSLGNITKDIASIQGKLQKLCEEINQHNHIGTLCTEALIHIDNYRSKIEKISKNYGIVNKKIFMIVNESFFQYIPKPLLHKRFSSSRIRLHVEKKYKDFYEFFIKKEKNPHIFFTWGYVHDYEVITEMNSHYINLPYYYLDHIFLLPSLAHESIHLAICDIKESDPLKIINLKNNLSDKFFYEFDKNTLKKVKLSVATHKETANKMSEEIIADIYGYFQDGPSYILTFSHLNLGKELVDYYGYKTNKGDYKDISSDKKYQFRYLRDFNIIRLHILIFIHFEKKKLSFEYTKFDEHILEMTKYITYVYKPENSEKYQDVQIIIDCIVEVTKTIIEDNIELLEKNKKLILDRKKEGKQTIYNDIWDKRFELIKNNKSMCNIHTRRILHKELIEKLGMTDKVVPYKLIYVKLASSIYYYSDDEILKLKNKIIENEGGKYSVSYNLFGIYDFCILIEKEENIEITCGVKEIDKNIDKNIGYHTFHHSIMNIMEPFTNENPGGNFSLIMQIVLSYNEYDKKKLLKFLENLKNRIIKKITQSYPNIGEISYFKSLGQGDIVIIANKISLDAIYDLKNKLSTEKLVSKTFSSIAYEEDSNVNNTNISISEGYCLTTLIKIKTNDTALKDIISIMHQKDENKLINEISIIAGTMDIQIIWKENNFIKVKSFYNVICSYFHKNSKVIIIDIQTSIGNKLLSTI